MFKTLKELMIKLADEKYCRDYVESMRWGGKPVCPHCGEGKPYRLKNGKTFRCKAKTCKKDFTVTVGTIFENSKIPLSTWMAAIYICTAHKKGISSVQLAKDLGVTQKSAWFMWHRIRTMLCPTEEPQLTDIVEVDETYVGGKLANMHSKKRKKITESGKDNKVPVMGLVQRDGMLYLKVKPDEKQFKDFVHTHVNPEAVVVTDAHLGYRGLDETHAGHMIVNHSQGEYKVGENYHTNTIEGFFSILKRGIYGIYHQVSPKHLPRYCEEFAYRYNSRKIKDYQRFENAIANPDGRLKYKDLTAKPKKPWER
jgi:transposase-like protein